MKCYLTFIAIFIISCTSPNEPYPSSAKLAFMGGCAKTQAEFCACTFDKISTQVPFAKLKADVQKFGGAFIYERPYIDAGLSCSKHYPKK